MFIEEYYPFIKVKESCYVNKHLVFGITLNFDQILLLRDNFQFAEVRNEDCLVYPYLTNSAIVMVKEIPSYEKLFIPGTKENIILWEKGKLCGQEPKLD